GRRPMPDKLELDPDAISQRLRDLHDHDAGPVSMDVAGRRIPGELREMQSDADLTRADEIGNPRVGPLLGGGSGRGGPAGRHDENTAMECHGIPPIWH